MINVGIIGGQDIRQGINQNINVSPNAKNLILFTALPMQVSLISGAP
jgi:hypothetical protein